MRYRFIAGALLVVCLLSAAQPVFAEGNNTGSLVLTKLFRGLTNLVTGWIEIPHQMSTTWKEQGPGPGLTWGFLKGIGYAVGRTGIGAYETVTFPIPVPEGYKPIMHPAYITSEISSS